MSALSYTAHPTGSKRDPFGEEAKARRRYLAEIERGADISRTLESYAGLPSEIIHAYAGDQFPPLFAVDGGRA